MTGKLEVRHLTFRYPNALGRTRSRMSRSRSSRGGPSRSSARPASGKSTLVNLLPRLHEPPRRHGLRRRARRPDAAAGESPARDGRRAAGAVPLLRHRRRQHRVRRRQGLALGRPLYGQSRRGDRGPRHGHRGLHATASTRSSASAASRCQAARSSASRSRARSRSIRASSCSTTRSRPSTPRPKTAILQELRGVRQSRSCLIVSHRVSTVRDAHEILVLDQGRVAERGTHDALVAAGGIYADMHRRQLLEAEIEELGQ